MRLLVTGGAGFLGSHLCDRLVSEGHEVICVDSLLTGRVENIAHLLHHPRFTFIRHDITQPFYVAGRIDWVLHFASPASPKDYAAHPIHTLKVGGLGTYHMLGLAKAHKAKFLLASTSEVYGDPEVHPQPETYWGNVNPIGERSCYDEAKRFSEALTMAYHRQHGLDVRIVRIFNSILADERVIVFNDGQIHLEPVAEYVQGLRRKSSSVRQILVPTFDPETGRVALKGVSAIIEHPCGRDAYRVRLSYGRTLRVTGDHSVFVRGGDGKPIPKPVRDLRPGEDVTIPAKLPVVEKDVTEIFVSDALIRHLPEQELWSYWVVSPQIPSLIERYWERLWGLIKGEGLHVTLRAWRTRHSLPLFVFLKTGIPLPEDAFIRCGPSGRSLPNRFPVTDEVLWFLGFFLAGGIIGSYRGRGSYFIVVSALPFHLHRAGRVLQENFGVRIIWGRKATRRPRRTLFAYGKLLTFILDKVFGVGGLGIEKRIPPWVFQLPLSRLKWFLRGYKDGSETSDGSVSQGFCLNAPNPRLADDLALLLLRFGLVAQLDEHPKAFREGHGKWGWRLYRLTLQGLSNHDILGWDKGVQQKLPHLRWGDLVWAKVEAVEPTVLTGYVYDFSVPGHQNFLAGNGVFAHNTYGPRMRIDDGRVLPTFLAQALRGEPLTVYGDGSQTRSFCYVDDLIEGILRVMAWEPPPECPEIERVFNLGNPEEVTVLQLAHEIRKLTGSQSPIVFRPLPRDDPKQRRPDISRAKSVLGWMPKVSRQEGILLTIPYFRDVLGIP